MRSITGHRTFAEIEQAREAIPRTLMLVGENKSASWSWRVEWPCRALANRGYISDYVGQTEIQRALFAIEAGRYNVIVTPRAHWANPEDANNWIDSVRTYGLAWCYELDDDGWSPEIVQRQARLYESEWAKGEQQLEIERLERIELINRSDGVIVSSPGLAKVARKYTNQTVYLVPNLIDADWFMARMGDAKRMIPPLTVGWSGGVRDESDLDIVAAAWTRVAKRYPQVKFIVHGVSPKVLTTSIPGDQLVMIGWSSLPDYPRACLNIDVACCAVAPNVDFNVSKSPIKWFEMSLAGSASVVSETLYGDVVTNGVDGLVCQTVDEWDEAISKLIEDEAYRRDMAEHAKQTVWATHTLEKGWPIWVETLAAVLASKQRVPNVLRGAVSV